MTASTSSQPGGTVDDKTEPQTAEQVFASKVRTDDRELAAGAVAESTDDLEKLVAFAHRHLDYGTTYNDLVATFVQELLNDPSWDRLELASVVGVAVADLALNRVTA